ncbi:unnamed protein product [Staurois parvus]|uniref:Uncharacterized protein n=1 Tax=Staurois parvus TaxID=386267 RepID=A0ABN9H8W0_9NEOB|nr:unnamed protein product [Staurois parvus]
MGPPYRLLMLLPGPRNLSWAPVRLFMLRLQGRRVSHGSLCGLPLLLSPSPHSARPCATFRSPHTDGGFHFVIGCCMAPIAAASHRHTVAPHSGLGP